MDKVFCSFCSQTIYPGHGLVFVKNNLKFYRFCRSKCRKLFHLKKNPLFLKWTLSSRFSRGHMARIKTNPKLQCEEKLDFNGIYNSALISVTLFKANRSDKQSLTRTQDFSILKISKNYK